MNSNKKNDTEKQVKTGSWPMVKAVVGDLDEEPTSNNQTEESSSEETSDNDNKD